MAENTTPEAKPEGIDIGRFRIEPWADGKVWIWADSGEGGEFPMADLEAVLSKFFAENF